MKAILFAILAAASLSAVAAATTPIDRDKETIVITNPTLEGKLFCGFNGKIIDAAVYVCTSQGYSQTQILERGTVSFTGPLCWIVEPKGAGNYYFELGNTEVVLTKVKCTRDKIPPISQPDPITDPNPYPKP